MKYIVGNWKMNQTLESVQIFANSLDIASSDFDQVNAWIAPQAMHMMPLIDEFAKNGRPIDIGIQNICEQSAGAFTGENSGASALELGAKFCLIGHSERRSIYNEDDDLLNKKVHQALDLGLKVIFCVGEDLEEREKGITKRVIENQLTEGLESIDPTKLLEGSLLIAYEPIWAIGTGEVATPEQATEIHQHIRQYLAIELGFAKFYTPLLYGGSVKPANVSELLGQKDIDGALVGGSSLSPVDFSELVKIAAKKLQ